LSRKPVEMGRLCGLGSVIFMHWPLMYENFNQSVSIKGQPLYSLSRVSILSSSFEPNGIQIAYSENPSISPNMAPAQDKVAPGETGSTVEDVDRDGFGLGSG
jgi:hypothetical protein